MKILMVGLGGIGQRHARNLRALLGSDLDLLAYRVRGLSDVVTPVLSLDAGKQIEQEYNIKSFTSLQAALAECPDVAFICNPSSLHLPVAFECAAAGCDLFIEKPLSDSLEGIERLIGEVLSQKRLAMVGYQLRFHPCLLRLKSLLDVEAIGRPLTVRSTVGEYLPFWHRYEDYRQMYAARHELGGGVILSQIHEMDYLYSLFGPPRSIFALGGHWSSLEIGVEDTASMLMECTWNDRVLPVHVQLDYLQYPPSRQCEIVGDNGKIVMDLIANEINVFTDRRAEPQQYRFEAFERNQLFLDEVRHFLKCVETRQQPMITLQDGTQSLRMALAAKESIETRQMVVLEFAEQKAR
jgi:predicted dehydrogenase